MNLRHFLWAVFSVGSSFGAQIEITTASDLMNRMQTAVAGDTLWVHPGTYTGSLTSSGDPGNLPNGTGFFYVGNNGTADNPIVISGIDPLNRPILQGTSISQGYVIHVTGDHVVLKNLIITQGDKGVVFDNSNYSIIEDCEIHNSGAELIHVRDGSSYVKISRNHIYNSGNGGNGSIGEGLYIGTDQARWGADDRPQTEWGDLAISEGYGGYDWRVHHTEVLCNYLSGSISAECMDVKEGTQYTTVTGNVFVGDSIGKKPGAQSYDDSFIDQKGVKGVFTDNSFCNCGNTLDRIINEVTRASYAHIPDSLTTDGHSRPWCDEGDADQNICRESENAIITVAFNPIGPSCAEVFPLVYGSTVPTQAHSISTTLLPKQLQLQAGQLRFQLSKSVKTALITIRDAKGTLLNSYTQFDLAPGWHQLEIKTQDSPKARYVQFNLDGLESSHNL
jgi:hypothetical protein